MRGACVFSPDDPSTFLLLERRSEFLHKSIRLGERCCRHFGGPGSFPAGGGHGSVYQVSRNGTQAEDFPGYASVKFRGGNGSRGLDAGFRRLFETLTRATQRHLHFHISIPPQLQICCRPAVDCGHLASSSIVRGDRRFTEGLTDLFSCTSTVMGVGPRRPKPKSPPYPPNHPKQGNPQPQPSPASRKPHASTPPPSPSTSSP